MHPADEVTSDSQAIVSTSPLLTSKDEIVELRILLIVFTVDYWLMRRLQEINHSSLLLMALSNFFHLDSLFELAVDDGEFLIKESMGEKYFLTDRDSKAFLHLNIALLS